MSTTFAVDAEVKKVIASLNKKHGSGTVVFGNEITEEVVPRLQTGSLALDLILGGGWPMNQAVEVIGEESSGKTTLALKTIAHNQAINPEFLAVWVAAEEWVPSYAEKCGVDISRIILVETNFMEDALDAVLKFAETKGVDAIVIDSLPALVPTTEDEKSMDEATVGRGALLINKFFRKVGKALKRSLVEHQRPISLIVINQFREKIGVIKGDPRTTPGGKGKNYAYFARVEVKRDAWIEVGPSSRPTKIGQSIRVRTIKNKSAPPQRTAHIDFYFTTGGAAPEGEYDVAKELVAVGILLDVIEGPKGGWYYFAGRKWNGVEALLASVREELDLQEQIDAEIRALPAGGAALNG